MLIGNGMSINVWPRFAYNSLLEQANLTSAAAQLFGDLDTTNFEVVLEGLWHAERVLHALRQSNDQVKGLYRGVQDALFEAIHRVHVPWNSVPRSTLAHIASVLNEQNLVFTLNYDLLTYWSVMDNTSPTYIGDYFWAPDSAFDSSDCGLAQGRTGVLYLHGGVHLWQESTTGLTGKWTQGRQGNLLSNLAEYFRADSDRQPLMVSEGTSAQKLAVIRRSEYLSFALRELAADSSKTVIFGAEFGSQDDHIVSALRAGGARDIAISVFPGTDEQNTATMARYKSKLPEQKLSFFDSRSHPLGSPAMTLRPD
ncbi:DUF4917 family protein [Mycobacteroides chelonae]|uniref:DUF4917 family protein n=1 Tax=Mycobacteroides chelonae TaxID=1774 RepID=UPI0012FF5FAC|nr:DUF4917 family protein [Mycobacteroides chelonae]MEC4841098.1 DUF4917 family protein [Mycobacteroides chelonae]MEC4842770.1 DUF4917 family protein [Mycobacteroides chelonae]WED92098.1 DUF4917 family protein [Mycobacteroides chelonae]WED95682.1 DUF4917 family protein [Mycobacteroides chelonae]